MTDNKFFEKLSDWQMQAGDRSFPAVSCSTAKATEEKYRRCTRRYDGTASLGYEVSCRLGLWSVSGPDEVRVEAQARLYWIQYFTDGEYDELLSSNASAQGMAPQTTNSNDEGY